MAEGYARVSGKPGIVLVTSGPGATNVITPMQDALSDGTPMIVFSGQVATSVIGSDAFQEADILGISRSCSLLVIVDPGSTNEGSPSLFSDSRLASSRGVQIASLCPRQRVRAYKLHMDKMGTWPTCLAQPEANC
jgi:hypothetical protein